MSPAPTARRQAPASARDRGLFGHAEAEQTLLDAYRGGRIPHAWLIGGEAGIGKATLAYRMARFVLAHPDPAAPAVQKATSLAVPAEHPVARRIAGQAHSDLLVLERALNEKTGKLFTVDPRRRCAADRVVLRLDRGRGRLAGRHRRYAWTNSNRRARTRCSRCWRSRRRAALLLLSAMRRAACCRPSARAAGRLMLRPLPAEDVVRACRRGPRGSGAPTKMLAAAGEAADGSVAGRWRCSRADALELRQHVIGLLDGLPELDQRALHALGDEIGGVAGRSAAAFMDTVTPGSAPVSQRPAGRSAGWRGSPRSGTA